MLRVIVAFVLLVALAPAAPSQEAPPPGLKLRELVTVADELVLIGDLVNDAGAAARLAGCRAPHAAAFHGQRGGDGRGRGPDAFHCTRRSRARLRCRGRAPSTDAGRR